MSAPFIPAVPYELFIAAKAAEAPSLGFEPPLPLSEVLFGFQRDIVRWACRHGRAGIFASFGLGKTFMQLEVARQTVALTGGRFLICAPLGVRQEFERDAATLGVPLTFVRTSAEVTEPCGVYLTNHESVREGKIDATLFDGVSLDEAACLRAFGGSKTFREMMARLAGDDRAAGERSGGVRFRFVATATPSPNEYIELLAYAAFLGVMDISQAKTRFFKRNSEKADALTLHPHKERESWLWIASWALFVTKPSDLGYSDKGYELPELEVHWHEVATDHRAHQQRRAEAAVAADQRAPGKRRKPEQVSMFADASLGVVDASREKRDSLDARVEKLLELRALDPAAHRVIWHDLESEREALEAAIPGLRSVFGTQTIEDRVSLIVDFAEGRLQELGAKPVMLGAGVNFQKHCAWAIYVGIGFKFADWIQSVHRLQRFLQTRKVRIDLIYTEAERGVRAVLERKWAQHKELVAQMTSIVREYGLTQSAMGNGLVRTGAVERAEVRGDRFVAVNNDCVLELRRQPADSIALYLTSIPFSTQYEYSPSYLDFGHTDNNEHFWAQMDYLSPELFRTLKPGRVLAVHVKDRIVPGGLTGLGFQTLYPFHCDAIAHYQRHGFALLGVVTIVTDVVRENNQTYRLAYTEQCKDGSRQGVGVPEYLLLFRKPQTDRSKGYADEPVVKSKEGYKLSRWQIDAAGFWRSGGDRLLTPDDFAGLTHDQIYKLFRRHSLAQPYDYEHHVALNEALEARGALPTDFSLLPAQSWSEHVWTDVTRMRTLNGAQSATGREAHLCPMQFDVAERVIRRFSMPGERVGDPFAGLFTVPMTAVKLGREGFGVELSPRYFADGVSYCHAAERAASVPTLFSLDALEQPDADAAE